MVSSQLGERENVHSEDTQLLSQCAVAIARVDQFIPSLPCHKQILCVQQLGSACEVFPARKSETKALRFC